MVLIAASACPISAGALKHPKTVGAPPPTTATSSSDSSASAHSPSVGIACTPPGAARANRACGSLMTPGAVSLSPVPLSVTVYVTVLPLAVPCGNQPAVAPVLAGPNL